MNNDIDNNTSGELPEVTRPWYVTVLLVFVMIWNLLSGIRYFFEAIAIEYPESAQANGYLYLARIETVLISVFILAILFRRKWGGYAFIVVGIAAVAQNFVSMGFQQSALNNLPVLILMAVLFIGKENQLWRQLK